jgi:hypothetical protein
MPLETRNAERGAGQVRLPKGVVLLPPVSLEDLKKDIGQDPRDAEEFVAFIRALRRPAPRDVKV